MHKQQKLRFSLTQLLVSAGISLAFLPLVSWLYSPEFSATKPSSFSASISLGISNSAGIIGTFIGVLVTAILYTLNEQSWKDKLKVFIKAFLGLSAVIILFAALNEKLTKPLLKAERPSHQFMLKAIESQPIIDSLYQLTKQERVAWFEAQVQLHKEKLQSIDQKVLAHWVEEGGYSFPSGHTFNAFLLAMIFAFGIAHNNKKPEWRAIFPAPFVWATAVGISRISLGVHTLYDVVAGAFLGIAFGTGLLWLNLTRNLITHKKFSS